MTTTRFSLMAATMALLLAGTAQAQGVFTRQGFGLEASASAQDDVTTFGAELGYVWNGLAEAGFSVARASDEQNGPELNAMAYTPFVGVYPLRQRDGMPVSLRLGTSYSFFTFSGEYADSFKDLGLEIDGHSYDVSGQVFRSFPLSSSVQIVPRVSASYVWATVQFDGTVDGEPVDEDETDGFEVISFAPSIAFSMRRGSVFTITPRVSFTDGESGFGLSTGFILPR